MNGAITGNWPVIWEPPPLPRTVFRISIFVGAPSPDAVICYTATQLPRRP